MGNTDKIILEDYIKTRRLNKMLRENNIILKRQIAELQIKLQEKETD